MSQNTSFTILAGDATIYADGEASAYCTSSDSNCMQYATACDTTLKDARDGNTYTVKTISGKCWMTQNLRFVWTSNDTLTSALTNVSSDTKITVGALASGNSYTEARIRYNNDTSYGAYYNFCAVTAGTICTDSNSTLSTYDICPKGWRMPDQSQINVLGGGNNSYTTTYVSAFSPVFSGYYTNGTLRNTGSNGRWWSRTAYGADSRYYLYYRSSGLISGSDYGSSRGSGVSVRCVRT